MTEHDWFVDHLLESVTGQLEPADAETMRKHLVHCAECRADVARLQDDLKWLPMAVSPASPRPGYTNRVLRAAVGSDSRSQWSRAVPWALAATTILSAGLAWQRQGQLNELHRELSDSAAALGEVRAMAASAADTLSVLRHATRVAYSTLASTKNAGGVMLLDDPTTHRWYVVAYGLPPLQPGQRYQFWFVGSDGMAKGSALVLSAEGMARLTTDMPAVPPGRILGAAITIESGASVPGGHGPKIATLML